MLNATRVLLVDLLWAVSGGSGVPDGAVVRAARRFHHFTRRQRLETLHRKLTITDSYIPAPITLVNTRTPITSSASSLTNSLTHLAEITHFRIIYDTTPGHFDLTITDPRVHVPPPVKVRDEWCAGVGSVWGGISAPGTAW